MLEYIWSTASGWLTVLSGLSGSTLILLGLLLQTSKTALKWLKRIGFVLVTICVLTLLVHTGILPQL